MSVEETLDALRAEVLRQKIVFEAELRRQREVYDARLCVAEQALHDREIDCRNLQSVITILGKKVDALQDLVTQNIAARSAAATPRRLSSPRPDATGSPKRLGSPVSNFSVPVRKDGIPSLSLFSVRTASQFTASRATSPGRQSTVSSVAARPRVTAAPTSVRNSTQTPRTSK